MKGKQNAIWSVYQETANLVTQKECRMLTFASYVFQMLSRHWLMSLCVLQLNIGWYQYKVSFCLKPFDCHMVFLEPGASGVLKYAL